MAGQRLLGPDSGWPALFGGLALSGIGMGLIFQVAASRALDALPAEHAGAVILAVAALVRWLTRTRRPAPGRLDGAPTVPSPQEATFVMHDQ
ncbi:hypothetical protein [Streptomyces sp. S186]|uniref:hypothetical protein n=1 Tax=Streptomyces sp. S186 TaxID=3434395 RepID=UPI003F67471D